LPVNAVRKKVAYERDVADRITGQPPQQCGSLDCQARLISAPVQRGQRKLMFKVGDTVRNVALNVVGEIVEIDGDTVYLEQSNGAEVDFAASALVLENEFQAQHDLSVRDDAASHTNDKIYDAVLGSLYPAIIQMGQFAHSQIKRVPGVAESKWESLSSLQKLNAISEATEIPIKTWIDSSRPSAKPSIGTLQLSVLAAAGKKAGR
jgi:hypothetical protein